MLTCVNLSWPHTLPIVNSLLMWEAPNIADEYKLRGNFAMHIFKKLNCCRS